MNPIPFIPGPKRAGHKRRETANAPTPVGPLMLVSATYVNHSPQTLTLVFDRAIDISAIDVSKFTVIDAAAHKHYRGNGTATLIDDVTVSMHLTMYASVFAPATTMSATDANGIVAIGDGDAWDGVTDLGLPFP